MQQINLDWILGKIRDMLRFIPDDGIVGQVLRRTAHGAEWSDESASGVSSVNGQTGDVVLDASDVGALPDSYTAPVTSVNGQTGAVSLSIPTDTSDLVNDSGFVDAAGAAAAAPVQSVNGLTGAVQARLPYFKCTTAAATVAKTITGGAAQGITSLWEGLAIIVYFTDTNTASNPTLQLDSLPAAPIYQYGTTAAGNTASTTSWNINSPVLLMYNGSGWLMNKGYNTNTTYTVTNVACITSAGTAAKTASGSYFSLVSGHDYLFEITFRYSNTASSKVTLNINSTGVKDVWLDGAVTSSTNKDIKAGHYIARYDHVNDCYQLYSQGRIMCDIIGTASGNYSAGNPPPYPVTSVNGQTGAVVISTSGVTVTNLYTNPDDTQNMSAGTLYTTTDIFAEYDWLLVTYKSATGQVDMKTEIITQVGLYCLSVFRNTGSNLYNYNRYMSVVVDTISVQGGYRGTTSGDQYCIILSIDGVKF